jgi:lipopolysaccharide transport system ATP-binding protein
MTTTKPIIEIKNLGKRYDIVHQQGGYVALRDVLANVFKNPFSFLKSKAKKAIGLEKKEEFWAIKDISFDVMPGEVIGIIGKNGSGKSTLLKILTGITPPTKGEVIMHGKVSSLLEVGTGFHPELSGRENIFLNGAILGMTRKEIVQKFDEIVAFSGIEKFLDTPVKHYSSGMQVRLAFSVAAHMEPDILIVDEVLAVGDAEFQKKCMGKMEEVTEKDGRTILFVSHDMSAIEKICTKVIILKEGKIEFVGTAKESTERYIGNSMHLQTEKKWENPKFAPGDNIVKITRTFCHKENGEISNTFDITKKVGVTIEYEVLEGGHSFTHSINLYNEDGVNVFDSHDVEGTRVRNTGKYSATAWIPGNLLAEGTFSVGVTLLQQSPHITHAYEPDALSFKVIDSFDGTSSRGRYMGIFGGIVRPLLKWDDNKKL